MVEDEQRDGDHRLARSAPIVRQSLGPSPLNLDAWVVPPDSPDRQKRGPALGRRTKMAQSLVELIEQFCRFQRKQKGKTEEGVETYRRWLES